MITTFEHVIEFDRLILNIATSLIVQGRARLCNQVIVTFEFFLLFPKNVSDLFFTSF